MSALDTTTRPRWRNWAGNERCVPECVVRPTSEAEIAAVVRDAFVRGGHVKTAGSGHSFTPLVVTDDVLVDLSRYRQVLAVDERARTVTVQAGITLRTLSRELARRGLALENLGDIASQTVAGAISTGTHGTGLRFGILSTQVVAMRLVLGTGQVVECSAHQNPKLFRVARVGVGAFGLISTVTLRCVPAFRLHTVEEARRVDEVMAAWPELLAEHDHFELLWIPRTGWAVTKAHRRTDDPARPRPLRRELRDDVLLDNLALGVLATVSRVRNDRVPEVAKALPSKGRVEYVDRSDRVFTTPRWVRFVEMEQAIPVEAVPAALEAVRALCEQLGDHRSFGVEVRAAAADDIPLSPAHGRPTGYISVHAASGEPYQRYFRGVDEILADHGARPHWGKVHFASAATLASRYPRWDDAMSIRSKVDPRGVFANRYLDHVLGPVA